MQDLPGPNLGIHHVALEIQRGDAEAARQFWRILGFAEVEPPESLRGRTIWLESGPAASPTQIHLLQVQSSRATAGHVAIVLPDFATVLAALRKAGFEAEDRRPHWGAARAFAGHPGGHTVELMAAPPPPSE